LPLLIKVTKVLNESGFTLIFADLILNEMKYIPAGLLEILYLAD